MIYAATRRTSNLLIDAAFRGQSITFPGTYWLALFKGDPEETLAYELAGGSYARISIPSTLSNWRATDLTVGAVSSGYAGYTSNPAAITFATPTATLAGTVTHWGLLDAASAGNVWFRGALRTTRTWTLGGSAITFPPGSLHIGLPWRG